MRAHDRGTVAPPGGDVLPLAPQASSRLCAGTGTSGLPMLCECLECTHSAERRGVDAHVGVLPALTQISLSSRRGQPATAASNGAAQNEPS